jgi:hypothetical protein
VPKSSRGHSRRRGFREFRDFLEVVLVRAMSGIMTPAASWPPMKTRLPLTRALLLALAASVVIRRKGFYTSVRYVFSFIFSDKGSFS